MKKKRRILALTGAALLAGLYIATLIFALIDSDWAYNMFKLCIGFTIIVPVLLYAYTLMYRLLSGKDDAAPGADGAPQDTGGSSPRQNKKSHKNTGDKL